MNHTLNIALVILFSTLLVGMIAWPFVKRWYYSRLKTPFEIKLNGRTYLFDPQSEEFIVDQRSRQDKVFDELERRQKENK